MTRMGTKRPAPRVRIDRVLVEKGLLESREKAARHILAGDVFVDGQRVDKAGALVSTTATIEVRAREPYVSRGGEKLVHALDSFQAKIPGRVCMDVGASTGGFTDCLLQRGAARVYAIDVGTGQLDPRLRADQRVVVMEHTNARALDPRVFGDQPTLAVIDVSFISLAAVLPAVASVVRPGGAIVALVKPPVEAPTSMATRSRTSRPKASRAPASFSPPRLT